MPILMTFLLALILSLSLSIDHAAAQTLLVPGDEFPDLPLSITEAESNRAYLGLADCESFTPSQIDSDLLLVELLNVHCLHCQKQARTYNRLFDRIETSKDTKEKIKILGIAVGNVPNEVENFKRDYKIAFPILADADFSVWRHIGGGTTPLAIYIRQVQPGTPGIIAGIHKGLSNDDQLFQTLIGMAQTSPAEYRRVAQSANSRQMQISPIYPDSELEFRVRSAFTRMGLIDDFSEISLLSGRKVYSALVRKGNSTERLFAEVASRSSVCDICHDVHFIYLFDRTARVIGFEPLQLTKYGNAEWDKKEVETMRSKVVGKYLTIPKPFDPTLDAITSATMTSAIIFDSLAQGEELFRELERQGLL